MDGEESRNLHRINGQGYAERCLALKNLADIVDLANLVGRELADGHSAIALFSDDSDTAELGETFAHLVPRSVESLGELFFAELTSGLELAEDDVLFQGSGNLRRKRVGGRRWANGKHRI